MINYELIALNGIFFLLIGAFALLVPILFATYKYKAEKKIFQKSNKLQHQKYQPQLLKSELSSILNETSPPQPNYALVGKLLILKPN